MPKVSLEEIKTLESFMSLADRQPDSSRPWYWGQKHMTDVPMVYVKGKKTWIEPTLLQIRFALKVQFNKRGREKNKYSEWPRVAFLMDPEAYRKYGFLSDTNINVHMSSGHVEANPDDYMVIKTEMGWGKYMRYRTNLWRLTEYEGTIK